MAQATSPNGKIAVAQKGNGLVIKHEGKQLIEIPTVGFESLSTPTPLSFRRYLKEDYTMPAGKQLKCSNEANEYLAELGKDA